MYTKKPIYKSSFMEMHKTKLEENFNIKSDNDKVENFHIKKKVFLSKAKSFYKLLANIYSDSLARFG